MWTLWDCWFYLYVPVGRCQRKAPGSIFLFSLQEPSCPVITCLPRSRCIGTIKTSLPMSQVFPYCSSALLDVLPMLYSVREVTQIDSLVVMEGFCCCLNCRLCVLHLLIKWWHGQWFHCHFKVIINNCSRGSLVDMWPAYGALKVMRFECREMPSFLVLC